MNLKIKNGFTVVELLLSIGILAILFTLTTINLGRLPSATSQSAVIDTLLSDLRSQQTLAMSNDSSYGIHFETGSYTLFKGSSYNSSDPANFVVTLDPGLTFSGVTFTGSAIVFSPGSGNVVSGSGSITLVNSQITQNKTININQYGASY